MNRDLLKNRFLELAERSYRKQIYTHTDFLSLEEQSVFYEIRKQISHVPYLLYGGTESAERKLLRFGSPDLCGYDAEMPIRCLLAAPRNPKFSETLSHRDFLGSLIGLGIDRSAVGDLFVKDNAAYLFCLENIAEYLAENYTQVRHTAISCTPVSALPEAMLPVLEKTTVQVSSERLDAVIAHVWHLSRSTGTELFTHERVYVNSALCTNPSRKPAEGDIVSVRGMGRFLYHGVIGLSKKGKSNLSVSLFK